MSPRLTEAAVVLTVRDVVAGAKHYRDVLGFSVAFEYGEPPSYIGVCRDDVTVHLASATITEHAAGHGDLAIFCEGVDAIHAELMARGANVLGSPEDRDYGMRDFSVVDPDGNRLTFGQAIARE
jgi:uncharacterized glyoxalase superfamily protein PhnB